MKNFYFKLIIVVSVVVIILVSNSHVFASSIVNDNVTVQQDVTYFANRDIDYVKQFVALNSDFKSRLEQFSTNVFFGILPSANDNRLRLFAFSGDWVTGAGSDVSYYGIITTTFHINRYYIFTLSLNTYREQYVPSGDTDIPSVFYLNSLSLLLQTSPDSSVASSVDENTNAVKESTEVSKETQNFIKDDSEVDDGEITSMTDSFNDLDDIQDSGSEDVGNIFNLFSNNRNHESDSFSFSLRVPFSEENMNITIDKDLTRNTLLSLCGGRASLQGLVITCINFLWSFLIFKFIVSNLISLIDKIKTGDITNIRTRNVLVDVL